MPDPYRTLGLAPNSTDDVIRRQYLSLVRAHTPERDPERFVAIREAYEKLRDPHSRLRYRLFEAGKDDSIEALLADAKTHIRRRRVPVATLMSWGQMYP